MENKRLKDFEDLKLKFVTEVKKLKQSDIERILQNNANTARNKLRGDNPFSTDDMIALCPYLGLNSAPLVEYLAYLQKFSEYVRNLPLPKKFILEILGGKDLRYLDDRIEKPTLWKNKDIEAIISAITNLYISLPS